jgi:signal transduction histidine kinase
LWLSFGPARIAENLPWLLVGWTCVASGIAARRVAPWSREWVLLTSVGAVWLVPDVSTCLNVEPISHRCFSVDVPGWLAEAIEFLWLGLGAHAVLTFPSGRVNGRRLLFAVTAAYALSLGVAIWAEPGRPLVADAAVIACSLFIVGGLVIVTRSRAALTSDRAVELGPALADVLGDPTFRISIGDDETPAPTTIERDGVEVARLYHDESTLADPQIRAAVVRAIELEGHNRRLRTDLEAQASAVAASRRRLLDAALVEGEAIRTQVDTEVVGRLDALGRRLRELPPEGLPTASADALVRARAAIQAASAEVGQLALGVYPPALADRGLRPALGELAASMTMAVSIDVGDDVRLGREAEATLYFVCAEALANAARHARASSVAIVLARSGESVTLTIEDDGLGGAVIDAGTGLRGLRDRVEVFGGAVQIDSPPRGGTRLVATIPVPHEARSD